MENAMNSLEQIKIKQQSEVMMRVAFIICAAAVIATPLLYFLTAYAHASHSRYLIGVVIIPAWIAWAMTIASTIVGWLKIEKNDYKIAFIATCIPSVCLLAILVLYATMFFTDSYHG